LAAVGLLTLEITLQGARSLKDKRQVVRSLKDRLKARLNVSVAEVGYHDVWQRSAVAVAAVGVDRVNVESVLAKAETLAAELLGGELSASSVEFL
jgi:uncharacterized protein YlxP (DUF503 family)